MIKPGQTYRGVKFGRYWTTLYCTEYGGWVIYCREDDEYSCAGEDMLQDHESFLLVEDRPNWVKSDPGDTIAVVDFEEAVDGLLRLDDTLQLGYYACDREKLLALLAEVWQSGYDHAILSTLKASK